MTLAAKSEPVVPLRPATPARVPARPLPKPDADASNATGRLLAWLKLYWLSILFLGSLLGSGLAYVAWTMLPSKFESYALLRVASSPTTVANLRDPNRGRTEFATYIKTNAQLIKNEFVLNKALSQEIDGVRISDVPTIREQKNPFQYLEDELQVSFKDGSEIITISLKGHNPDDVRRIVNAVQKAFMDEVIEKEIKERQDHLALLERTLINLQTMLNAKTGRTTDTTLLPASGIEPKPLPNLLPQTVTAGPPDWAKKQMAMAQVSKVLQLQELLKELPTTIANQENRLILLKKQIETPPPAPAPPPPAPPANLPTAEQIASAIERDPDVANLVAREQQLRRDAAIDRSRYNNPNAPSILAKLERAAELAAEANQVRATKREAIEKALQPLPQPTVVPQQQADARIAQYQEAELKLNELKLQYDTTRKRLTEELNELAKLPADPTPEPKGDVRQAKAETKKTLDSDASLIESEDGIFRGLAQKTAEMRLELNSPKRVTVLQAASSPMQRDGKKQILGSAFAGLLGFAFIGLFAVGYETVTKKICTLGDVQHRPRTPVVGVVPWHPDALNDEPIRKGDITEAFDKLRAYIGQTWLPKGATLISVTSPHTDEGKAITAFRLADSLTRAGYRTLLVDFDLRKPAIHTLAGCDNTAGVCELLRGESDFATTIRCLDSGLRLLPAGQWSEEVRRASGSGRLEQLLACVKEPFDCVVLHSHAMLTAAESIEVLRRSEAVLVCALCRETRLPLFDRAIERVATMDVPFSGIVYLGATPQEALC